jgi:hypothetical protein
MSPPLAVLNVEEMHWQSDLGLPNQRRWLNHRNIGDEHRRTFPSAGGILTQRAVIHTQMIFEGAPDFNSPRNLGGLCVLLGG